jgi:L-ribulose-5-phosphate 4-epimerase
MTASVTYIDFDLDAYIETAVADATHAFNFLKESGTLSASLIFNVSHRIPGHDKLLSLRFPQPWERDKTVTHSVAVFSERTENILHEPRLDAQAIAAQIGGAQPYTPGALALQWKRTGLLEKSKAYSG